MTNDECLFGCFPIANQDGANDLRRALQRWAPPEVAVEKNSRWELALHRHFRPRLNTDFTDFHGWARIYDFLIRAIRAIRAIRGQFPEVSL